MGVNKVHKVPQAYPVPPTTVNKVTTVNPLEATYQVPMETWAHQVNVVNEENLEKTVLLADLERTVYQVIKVTKEELVPWELKVRLVHQAKTEKMVRPVVTVLQELTDHQALAADPANSERKVLQANEVNQVPLADEVTKANEAPQVSEAMLQPKPKSTRKNPKNEVIPAETVHQALEEAEVHAVHEDKMANKVHQVTLVLTAVLASKVLQV